MIPFNRPHLTGREFTYIQEAAAAGQLAGNGRFTQRCHAWLERTLGARKVLLTHSATAVDLSLDVLASRGKTGATATRKATSRGRVSKL